MLCRLSLRPQTSKWWVGAKRGWLPVGRSKLEIADFAKHHWVHEIYWYYSLQSEAIFWIQLRKIRRKTHEKRRQRKERMTMVLHRNKSEQSKYLQTVIHLSLQIVVKHQQRSVVPWTQYRWYVYWSHHEGISHKGRVEYAHVKAKGRVVEGLMRHAWIITRPTMIDGNDVQSWNVQRHLVAGS